MTRLILGAQVDFDNFILMLKMLNVKSEILFFVSLQRDEKRDTTFMSIR